MPFIDIHVLKGTLSREQKRNMVSRVIRAISGVQAGNAGNMPWVRIQDVDQEDWAARTGVTPDAPVQSVLNPYQIVMSKVCSEDRAAA